MAMDKQQLITIITTTTTAVVVKEFISWLIKTTNTAVAAARQKLTPWINQNRKLADLIFESCGVIFFGFIFFIWPPSSMPVTQWTVRLTAFLASILSIQVILWVVALRDYKKWKNPPKD